ncbi:hypothetical protein N7533_006207 [Penicillium manginii]|uniref:uncharacterized protein n=1 Tax=Penicillium manginii TaxID=203109 RepID=UPI002548D8BB|nr:uncharacterized protein N7533_006207 [Penicillium manginii]KAJ5756664.1 hypothetical protein N7533_006207 [Penicillium manginii]
MSRSTRFGRNNSGSQVGGNYGQISHTHNNFVPHSTGSQDSERENVKPLASYLSSPELPFPSRGHAHLKIFNVYGEVSHFTNVRARRGPKLFHMNGLPSLRKGKTGEVVPAVYRPAIRQFSGYIILSNGKKHEFDRVSLRHHQDGHITELRGGDLPDRW